MKATVLLIDDDPVDLKSLQLLLESLEYDVIAERSGSDALARLSAATVDAIVCDVRMPGMSGEDVVKAVAQAHAGTPVLLVTAHGDIRSAVRAMKLGAFDYVLKPPDADELRLSIDRALEHSRLRGENAFLRAQLAAGGMHGERLIGRSPAMLAVLDLVDRVAPTDSTVLITGETGTGKELVAQTIHYRSLRAERPLVALNCAALNVNLIESELFGHEKGAFTGAVAARRGRFEDADSGTLFLDEIAETTPEFQSKLLRVLQERELERVGGNRRIPVDVRLLASTNRDLAHEVKEGRFREDLYYRLSVIPVRLPPLREREGDVALLANHFVDVYGQRYGNPGRSISGAGLAYLSRCDWPGNVRELQHAVERAVVLSREEVLGPDDFGPPERDGGTEGDTLHEHLESATRDHVLHVLEKTDWHKTRAAAVLGVDRATLYRILKKHSILR